MTGGASYRDERRALARRAGDHRRHAGAFARSSAARRRSTPASSGAIVLDEADRMLDLGFREDLEAILAFAPEEHRTHLISATFPRDVRALADRVQREPAHVRARRSGRPTPTSITWCTWSIRASSLDAIINLLLANPDEQTLVFVSYARRRGRARAELERDGLRGRLDLGRDRSARAQSRAR